jgi:membrane protein DedA with SNARE-associated domain
MNAGYAPALGAKLQTQSNRKATLVHLFDPELLNWLIVNYGYLAVAIIVGLESMGIPLPGETLLIAAAVYASQNPDLNITLVVLAATLGAILGDNVGYWVGSTFGYPLLKRFGPRIGVPENRIRLGQYLFDRYGFWVVFLGRFVALLRILAAFLAGVNRMHWGHFFVANALGGILWSAIFGYGAYYLGTAIGQMNHMVAPFLVVGAIAAFLAGGYLIKRYEKKLQAEADRAMPGPLA